MKTSCAAILAFSLSIFLFEKCRFVASFIPNCNDCHDDLESDTPKLVKSLGYGMEIHQTLTKDGYRLTMHRIPGRSGSPTVLLQHGLLATSSCWLLGGKEHGLAYILADAGYDVWMGNARGNFYSKNHTKFKTSDEQFWNFSFTEMGIYDLPAVITYITNIKNGKKLLYVGHSMGTTMSYVMAIKRPDIASKINAMFSLSPVAYTEHLKAPFIRALGSFPGETVAIRKTMGDTELFPKNKKSEAFAKNMCSNEKSYANICVNFLFNFCGLDFAQFNYSLTKTIINSFPAGSSTKTLLHYAQEIASAKFEEFDYGTIENIKVYRSFTPPEFNLTKVNVPVALFWSKNDWCAHPKDVKRLYKQLPNVILNYKINNPTFNHMDFLWGTDAPKLVYEKLLTTMAKYQ